MKNLDYLGTLRRYQGLSGNFDLFKALQTILVKFRLFIENQTNFGVFAQKSPISDKSMRKFDYLGTFGKVSRFEW